MTTRLPSIQLICIVALGVIVVGLLGMSGYSYVSAASLARTTAERQQELTEARRKVAQLRAAREHTKPLAGRITQRSAAWTWSEQMPEMMTQISPLIEQSGVVIDTMQPAPVVLRQQITRFPLRLTLHSHLKNLTGLLRRVQKASPLLAVDHVTIHAGELPGDPLRVELTLSSYVLLGDRAETGGRP